MPVLVAAGDRIVLPSGRVSPLARPSAPWSAAALPQTHDLLDGRTLSYRRLAADQPWVAVAVNGMARQVSRLPWKVFKRDGEGRARDRTSVPARTLHRPDIGRSVTSLKYQIMVGLLIDGNHVERKVTVADGRPGLRPLDWRWLIPYVYGGRVVSWEYRPPDGEPELIDPADVVHYRWEGFQPGPLGVSPLAHLGVTLRSEDAAQRWSEGNLRNGARVGVAVVMDPAVRGDADKLDALREQIVSRYVGADNSGRPLILGGGVSDVKAIGAQTPVEAALIDQRRLNREEVLAVYGYPAPLAGDLTHATYSNVAELARSLFTITLPPWLELVQSETTAQLIGGPDPSAHYTEFDLSDVTRGDPVQRMNAYRLAIQMGVLTVNEVRELENRQRFADPAADLPLVQANNVAPLAQLVAATAAAATSAGARAPPAPADVDGDDESADPRPVRAARCRPWIGSQRIR